MLLRVATLLTWCLLLATTRCVCIAEFQRRILVFHVSNPPPFSIEKVDIARMMIDGVRRAGINNCVVLSSIGADATDKPSLSKFRDIEEIFKNAGFTSSCILRGGFYSQNLLLYVDQLNEGVLKLVGFA
jgi:hypothetical protein